MYWLKGGAVRPRVEGSVDDDEGAEAGFTLIELMVVLLIMAILMAIAIPTFLGVRSGAQDRSAQSDLVNSAYALKSIFTVDDGFHSAPSEISELASSEPEMNYMLPPVTTANPPHQIGVVISPDLLVALVVDESATGRCWYLEENEEPIAGAAVPTDWSASQGFSYGGTSKGLPPFANCNTTFIPFLVSPDFTGWSMNGFPQ